MLPALVSTSLNEFPLLVVSDVSFFWLSKSSALIMMKACGSGLTTFIISILFNLISLKLLHLIHIDFLLELILYHNVKFNFLEIEIYHLKRIGHHYNEESFAHGFYSICA